MKRLISAIILAVMMIGILASCGAKSDVPDGYQLVACEGDEFRLFVPTQGWMPNTTGGVTSAFFSMTENSSVGVYVARDAGEMTVEEYWEVCHANYKSELDEYSYVGKAEKLVLGGEPAQKYRYSAKITVENVENTVIETYKFMQVMAKHEGKMYIFIYSAPERYYDSHLVDVEGDGEKVGMLGYFKFDEPYKAENGKQYSDKVEVPAGMKLISTDERAYRFFVPESWVDNSRAKISAAYASESDRSNVSLQMYMTENEAQTLDEYFAECENRYKDVYAAYALNSSEDIEMDGVAAKKYIFTVTTGGKEYKQLQAIVKKGAVFYTLTYTAEKEIFESHLADVEKMIESFDIR